MNTMIGNKNNIFSGAIIVLFFVIFLLTAKNVLAAEISLELSNKKVSVGDTVAIDVMINTEGELVNVVEGDIKVPGGLDLIEVKELNVANSVLNQWIRTPSWSKKDGTISFLGGLPGGFNQKSVSLFRIFFTANAAGLVSFSPSNIKIYANDGLATQVGVHANPLNIEIGQKDNFLAIDELKSTIAQDFKSPINISVDLGQDDSLFDGQKFINISAIDNETGIAYFEVKEGNREPVKTNNSYVLQNQNELEPIVIFAFDKAGNVSKRILEPSSKASSHNYLVIVQLFILTVGLLASLFILFRIVKKRKKVKK